MWANAAVDVLAPIAVAAENLIAGWKLIAPQPIEECGPAASDQFLQFPPMRCAVVFDMIDRQKHRLLLATANALKSAVSHKDFFANLRASLCLVRLPSLFLPTLVIRLPLFGVRFTPLVHGALAFIPMLLAIPALAFGVLFRVFSPMLPVI